MKFVLFEEWVERSNGARCDDRYWHYVSVHSTLEEAIGEAYDTLTELAEDNEIAGEELIDLVIFQATNTASRADILAAGKAMKAVE